MHDLHSGESSLSDPCDDVFRTGILNLPSGIPQGHWKNGLSAVEGKCSPSESSLHIWSGLGS